MSFIRAKEIPPHSGNWYDYEVESVWNKGKVTQKHIRYIGKSSRVSGGGSVSPAMTATTTTTTITDDVRIPKMKTSAIQNTWQNWCFLPLHLGSLLKNLLISPISHLTHWCEQ